MATRKRPRAATRPTPRATPAAAPGVSAEELAQRLHLESERRVQQLAKDEGMPRLARGRYDPEACTQWYIQYLQRCVQRRGGPDPEGEDAKDRLTRLQADLKQIEKDRLLGTLVTLDEHRAALSAPLLRIAAAIKGAHVRHAHRIVQLPDLAAARRELQAVFADLLGEMRLEELDLDPPVSQHQPAA